MHETGCSGLVHWDDPEGWDGEGGGREGQDEEHMYTRGWFMWMYGKNHHNTVISLQLKWNKNFLKIGLFHFLRKKKKRAFFNTAVQKHQFFSAQLSLYIVQLSHPYMTTGKTIALTKWIFVGKVMSLLFNTLSRLVITFLPKSKHLLISWLQSPSAVILEPKK